METLVVVGVIALLAALLAPAIAFARRQSLSSVCLSRLASLGKAVWQYHDVHYCLPIGRRIGMDVRFAGANPMCTSRYYERSVHVALLDFVEAAFLAESFNQCLAVACLENTTSFQTSVALYYCPADSVDRGPQRLLPSELALFLTDPPGDQWRLSATSYTFAYGTHPLLIAPSLFTNCRVPKDLISQCNGLFNDVSPISAAHMIDGAAHTAMATEQAAGRIRTVRATATHGSSLCKMIVGNLGETLATSFASPNRVFHSSPSVFESIGTASSFHDAGVNVLFADGSVRFVADSVQSWNHYELMPDMYGGLASPASPGVWQRFFDRHDGGYQ